MSYRPLPPAPPADPVWGFTEQQAKDAFHWLIDAETSHVSEDDPIFARFCAAYNAYHTDLMIWQAAQGPNVIGLVVHGLACVQSEINDDINVQLEAWRNAPAEKREFHRGILAGLHRASKVLIDAMDLLDGDTSSQRTAVAEASKQLAYFMVGLSKDTEDTGGEG